MNSLTLMMAKHFGELTPLGKKPLSALVGCSIVLSGCATAGVPLSDGGLLSQTVGNDVNIQPVSTAAYRLAEAEIEYSPKNSNSCLDQWKKTNEAGILAWCEGYVLSDLLDRFEYANDTTAAGIFLDHEKQIMKGYNPKSRDRGRGGRHTRGWVSNKFSDGKPAYWLVHTGQVIANFARFSAIVKRKKLKRFDKDAQRLAKTANLFFRSYETDWDGRRYHLPGRRDNATPSKTALALNMQATFGMTAIHLFNYNGSAFYRTRAKKIADYTMDFFKVSLDLRGAGVVWPYSESEKTEDTSHALLTLRFVHLAMENNISVTPKQYRTIVKSFISRATQTADNLSSDVSGKRPGTGPSLSKNCYRMMHIARYNQRLFALCQKVAKAQRSERKSFTIARD